MKTTTNILAGCLCACLAGCYTMDMASTASFRQSKLQETDAQPVEHVIVANNGWYLFDVFPIVCGNTRTNASTRFVFFSDQVSTDVVHDKLTRYAAEKHLNVADLNLIFNERAFFAIPGLDFPIPLPNVLTYRERSVSGVLVKPASRETIEKANQRRLKRDMTKLLEKIPDGGVK